MLEMLDDPDLPPSPAVVVRFLPGTGGCPAGVPSSVAFALPLPLDLVGLLDVFPGPDAEAVPKSASSSLSCAGVLGPPLAIRRRKRPVPAPVPAPAPGVVDFGGGGRLAGTTLEDDVALVDAPGFVDGPGVAGAAEDFPVAFWAAKSFSFCRFTGSQKEQVRILAFLQGPHRGCTPSHWISIHEHFMQDPSSGKSASKSRPVCDFQRSLNSPIPSSIIFRISTQPGNVGLDVGALKWNLKVLEFPWPSRTSRPLSVLRTH